MPEFTVVGASPELLVRVEGDRMTTHPIAGTRPRGATPAEDDALAYALERDPKERAEHVMLVDLGRNDLGRVARAGTVAVTKYMEVERYSHVLHLVSNVEARLKPGLDALDALRSIFPAGTLSGAPKVRAMQLIAEAEKERRGLYGGAVGYLGYDGNLDTAITIRSARRVATTRSTSPSARASSPAPCPSASSRRPSTRRRRSGGPSTMAIAEAVAPRPPPERAASAPSRLLAGSRSGRGRRRGGLPMILMIDNYDSFTFNLVQALEAAGADVRVLRNDAIDRAGLEALAADPAAEPARHRRLARSRRPRLGRRLDGRDPLRHRAPDPAAGRVPGHAVDGPGAGRHGSGGRRRSSTARRRASATTARGLAI